MSCSSDFEIIENYTILLLESNSGNMAIFPFASVVKVLHVDEVQAASVYQHMTRHDIIITSLCCSEHACEVMTESTWKLLHRASREHSTASCPAMPDPLPTDRSHVPISVLVIIRGMLSGFGHPAPSTARATWA